MFFIIIDQNGIRMKRDFVEVNTDFICKYRVDLYYSAVDHSVRIDESSLRMNGAIVEKL